MKMRMRGQSALAKSLFLQLQDVLRKSRLDRLWLSTQPHADGRRIGRQASTILDHCAGQVCQHSLALDWLWASLHVDIANVTAAAWHIGVASLTKLGTNLLLTERTPLVFHASVAAELV